MAGRIPRITDTPSFLRFIRSIEVGLSRDTDGILIQQTANVQSARQIRFRSLTEAVNLKSIVKAYVNEAIAVEKAGLRVKLKDTTEFKMPEVFEQLLTDMPKLKSAFYQLPPPVDNEATYFTFLLPSKPKQGKHALRNTYKTFWMEKDWRIRMFARKPRSCYNV